MDLAINIDASTAQPLHQQLYQELRRSILKGRLGAGQRIPSTRSLAKSLGISRATVTLSYEHLASEGYLETVAGSGTSVSRQLPEELLHTTPLKKERQVRSKVSDRVKLSAHGEAIANFVREQDEPELVFNFKYLRPAVDQFPLQEWRRLLLRHCRSGQTQMLDYAQNGKGYAPLREALARYLGRSRAVQCTAEQILIVNGSQQALHLTAQVLVNQGDLVAMEEPGYLGARHAFLTHGAKLHPVQVDEAGILPSGLAGKSARLLYVTPSHQFPTGAVLSLPRRLELLAWAEKNGSLIIEDDYDSEFRYSSRPIPALQGLAQNESVLYIGTFSKMLFPSLRIGYLIVPSALANVFERAKWLMDRHAPTLEQHVLADFINMGHLERHLRRMRTLYDRRRRKLVGALQTHFGERVTILGESSGMHLMIRLNSRLTHEDIMRRAQAVGVGLLSARIYYLTSNASNEFVLGYAMLSERRIQEGIRQLALALRD